MKLAARSIISHDNKIATLRILESDWLQERGPADDQQPATGVKPSEGAMV